MNGDAVALLVGSPTIPYGVMQLPNGNILSLGADKMLVWDISGL
jgi:hypothetical protein